MASQVAEKCSELVILLKCSELVILSEAENLLFARGIENKAARKSSRLQNDTPTDFFRNLFSRAVTAAGVRKPRRGD